MYVDVLTIAALIVFIVSIALFIRFCVLSMCGTRRGGHETDQARHSRVNRP